MTVIAAPSLPFPSKRLFPDERRLACGAALTMAVVLLSSVQLERFIRAPAPTLMAVGLLLIMTLSKLPVGPPVPVILTPIDVERLITESRTLMNALLPMSKPVGSPSSLTRSRTPATKPTDVATVIPLTAHVLMLVSLTNKLPAVAPRPTTMPLPFPALVLPWP